jgi:Acetyltransferase (GNAT) domain
MRGLSQDKEFATLMGNYSSVPINRGGTQVPIQYQRTTLGPIEYLAFGLGHELGFKGNEMEEMILRISAKQSAFTILYVNSIKAARVSGTDIVKTHALILDLSSDIKPRKKRRHAIKAALDFGLRVEEATDRDLTSCLGIAAEFAIRKKAGFPGGEITRLYGTPFGKLLVAKREDRIVGFIFLLLDRSLGKVYYKHGMWNAEGLRCQAPSLLVQEAITFSRGAGFRAFDFYGVSQANEKASNIARFKLSFGGSLEEYYRIRTILLFGRRMPALIKLGSAFIDRGFRPVTWVAENLHAKRSS